ncbi:hypothetical protein [Vibrio splendidus]|uniref:hypothetical protein n=1 Tax=Vibrio splendidus TaxID=29497 RepID=UPI002468E9EC|nr:hypothetical protein [Vibrio splendidus]MDH5934054.1 hypothetical protein [Vibrio splendidus]
MAAANSVDVVLLNGLTRTQVEAADYTIYGFDFGMDGFYVGMSNDFVTRYFSHYHSAWKEHNDRGCNSNLKKVMRNFPNKTYIIAVARTQAEAKAIKSAAMAYYDASLNAVREDKKSHDLSGFQSINKEYGTCTLYARKDTSDQHRNSSSERSMVLCEIVWERSKKRVKCIDGQFEGLYVQCSQKERDLHLVGAKVRVNAALAKGKNQLVAPKTDKLLAV